MTDFGTSPSPLAREVLDLLRTKHNVLITGPPATGKSHLLAEVKHWFTFRLAGPTLNPGGAVVFPRGGTPLPWMPAPGKTSREAWSISFHQGTKRHDFVNGLTPVAGRDAVAFQVVDGPVVSAARHAAKQDGAALVIIDEINRGPAIALFGDLITGMESDKRLKPDGQPSPHTQSITVLDAEGKPSPLPLPHDVYFLAAMNEADTSVEPLDVAFRRRFHPVRLEPDEAKARAHLGIVTARDTPETPATHGDVLEALLAAWRAVNQRIRLGRGAELQIGHGVLMQAVAPAAVPDALAYAADAWARIHAHVSEVFYGDTAGLATVLSAGSEGSDKPYKLTYASFGDTTVSRLTAPERITTINVYEILRAVAAE